MAASTAMVTRFTVTVVSIAMVTVVMATIASIETAVNPPLLCGIESMDRMDYCSDYRSHIRTVPMRITGRSHIPRTPFCIFRKMGDGERRDFFGLGSEKG